MKSAITIALVPDITYGPWVYWHHLEEGMQKAAALGFDAVELFTKDASLDTRHILELCTNHRLRIAAVGTGAGKVIHGLTLTDADISVRKRAITFIEEMIHFGAVFGAPAIIGSMQGNVAGAGKEETLQWLATALTSLGEKAKNLGVPLIYEPLNRYETNLFNTLGDAAAFLTAHQLENVKLLADLFHMNIEETDMAKALIANARHLGHVHFADSNRRAIGMGHTDMQAVSDALKQIDYKGYVSAEVFPLPDTDSAALQTITAFKKWFGN